VSTAATTTVRFLSLSAVAGELGVSRAQAYALVRRGDLPAIKVGGRGQWRVERAVLEDYIKKAYAAGRTFIEEHPFGEDTTSDADELD
jgi:excisionase family DNA binding protein